MFKNMKLGTKLQGIFLIISFMGFIVAALGIYNMGKIHHKAEEIYQQDLMGISYIKEANINLIYIGRARSNYMLATTEEDRLNYKKIINESTDRLKSNLDNAKKLLTNQSAKDLFSEYEKSYNNYMLDVNQFLDIVSATKLQESNNEIKALTATITQKSTIVDNILTSLSNIQQEEAKKAFEETTVFYENSRLLMAILVISSTCLGMFFGIMMTRSVTHKLGGEPEYAVNIAKRISKGDLTVEIEVSSKDQNSLLFAMKEMRDNLANIVTQVKSGTQTIKLATDEIAKGNMDLSHRTEEQASALEETASSMEEMNATVAQNAENSNEASKLAKVASEAALISGKEVEKVLHTMDNIEKSSKEMVDIITTVESIAFQTNILALNAAVEAARAGEQGRGFAVVASEVRNLAHRSANAAKEIKQLIDKSVSNTSLGSVQVRKAGESMSGVLNSIQKVSELVNDISFAGKEQSAGIGQVNDAIMQMDSVTQQNAALVEEAAAAAHSLQEQAGMLTEMVSVFKVDDSVSQPEYVAIVSQKSPTAQLEYKKPVPTTLAQKTKVTSEVLWERF